MNRYANGHRRRQVRAEVFRDEDHCGICGQLVDKTLPPYLPASPEVDEIVPVSKGGSPFDRDNCRLTHRRCNARRGNGSRPHPVIARFTTTRTW
jgi:5-methylcytosine-specific restriction endonuclease McrA